MPSSDQAWPEAKMMALEQDDVSSRAKRRGVNKGLTARLAMGLSLACLIAVAVVGMLNTPRPVEDVIVGVFPSCHPCSRKQWRNRA